MAACADETDESVPGAERTGKGYLEQTMEREKTQRLAAALKRDLLMQPVLQADTRKGKSGKGTCGHT